MLGSEDLLWTRPEAMGDDQRLHVQGDAAVVFGAAPCSANSLEGGPSEPFLGPKTP